MKASIETQLEAARIIVEQGGCMGVCCDDCPSDYGNHPSGINRCGLGGHDGGIQVAEDFIKEHGGEATVAKPKDTKERDVCVTWGGVQYTKHSINSETLEDFAATTQSLIVERNGINEDIRERRKQMRRYEAMNAKGELD